MNQAGYACIYVYDCCKLLQVFSAPVLPRPPSSLFLSPSRRLPSSLHQEPFFILPFRLRTRPFLLLPSRRVCVHLCSMDARHRRVHRTSCSSCLLNRLDTRLNYSRHREFDAHVFWKFYNVTNSTSTNIKLKMPLITCILKILKNIIFVWKRYS